MAPTIGLNLLFLAPGETGGMEIALRALVPELVRAWPEARYVAFCPRELDTRWDGVRTVRVPVSARTRVRRTAGEQLLLPGAVARAGVDLLHSPANTMPAWVPARTVTTVHDLIHARFADTHAGPLAAGLALLVRLSAARADRLIAVSEATKRDLVDLLGADAGRIDVVPNGPGARSAAPPAPVDELRQRLDLGDRPIVLSVSAVRPHKNLARLVRAIARLPDPVLVVAGYRSAHADELLSLAASLGVADRVRLTGWIDEETLEGLYAAADVMAFPSLYEGFGLPVLEAMSRGVAVACSHASSLPEVAGDAALLFDPESVDDIVAAIGRLLGDAPLRARLAERGRRRAAGFSWERTARETVAVYRRALGR